MGWLSTMRNWALFCRDVGDGGVKRACGSCNIVPFFVSLAMIIRVVGRGEEVEDGWKGLAWPLSAP